MQIELKESDLKGRKAWAEKLRKLNLAYPWLKIVLLLAFLSIAVAIIGGIIKHNVSTPPEKTPETSMDRPNETDGKGESEGKNQPQDQPEAPAEEKPSEEAKPPEKPSIDQSEGKDTSVKTPPTSNAGTSSGQKLVALTFDDGPSATTTARLLDILAQKNVKVTFFVLGSMAQRYPDMVKREAEAGHEVNSHTMNHLNLIKYGANDIKFEVSQADAMISQATGVVPKLVRPPYGSINNTVRANIGKPMILWTVDPQDWKVKNAATVRARVVGNSFDGAIILLHDIHATTVDAVPGIIDDLRAAGYEFMTVSELAAKRGITLQNGYSYGSFRP